MAMDGRDVADAGVLDELGEELVRDLANQSRDQIRKLRSDERLELRLEVVVRPGNASERHAFAAHGVTRDLSAGGARLLLPTPLVPGDLYRIEFADKSLDLPAVFGRCMRASMVREDAFEAGLQFFGRLNLDGLGAKRED